MASIVETCNRVVTTRNGRLGARPLTGPDPSRECRNCAALPHQNLDDLLMLNDETELDAKDGGKTQRKTGGTRGLSAHQVARGFIILDW